MPNYVDNNVITFNGPSSVADIFSNPVNLTGNFNQREVGWFFELNCTAAGVWAVTLQFNPDPGSEGDPEYGWRDEARSTITVLNTATSANLAQTNGSISGGILRAGVISSTGVFPLFLRHSPAPYSYRLRFQLTAAMTGTIQKISFSSGV